LLRWPSLRRILPLGRLLAVLAGRRTAGVTLLRRLAVLTRRRCTITLLGRLAILTGRRCTAITLLRCSIALRRAVGSLVLGIVRRINGSKEQFHNPEVRGKVDGRDGARHLFLLVLVIGSTVDHGADLRILVELSEELLRHLVVSDLGKFECDCTLSVLGEALERIKGIADGIEHGVLRFSSGLSIGDSNDQDRLAELA
jgi:hypothetical protein